MSILRSTTAAGLTLNEARNQAVISGRLEKWLKMATFGLDAELASRVITKKNRTPLEPISFSKYAKIGLMNFYESYPTLFRSRLSKGPPP